MSGRRSKKNQKLGSSRRGPTPSRNIEKDDEELFGESEQGQTKIDAHQFDLTSSTIDSQTSKFSSHSDSQQDVAIEPEQKRKLGSTRQKPSGFKVETTSTGQIEDMSAETQLSTSFEEEYGCQIEQTSSHLTFSLSCQSEKPHTGLGTDSAIDSLDKENDAFIHQEISQSNESFNTVQPSIAVTDFERELSPKDSGQDDQPAITTEQTKTTQNVREQHFESLTEHKGRVTDEATEIMQTWGDLPSHAELTLDPNKSEFPGIEKVNPPVTFSSVVIKNTQPEVLVSHMPMNHDELEVDFQLEIKNFNALDQILEEEKNILSVEMTDSSAHTSTVSVYKDGNTEKNEEGLQLKRTPFSEGLSSPNDRLKDSLLNEKKMSSQENCNYALPQHKDGGSGVTEPTTPRSPQELSDLREDSIQQIIDADSSVEHSDEMQRSLTQCIMNATDGEKDKASKGEGETVPRGIIAPENIHREDALIKSNSAVQKRKIGSTRRPPKDNREKKVHEEIMTIDDELMMDRENAVFGLVKQTNLHEWTEQSTEDKPEEQGTKLCEVKTVEHSESCSSGILSKLLAPVSLSTTTESHNVTIIQDDTLEADRGGKKTLIVDSNIEAQNIPFNIGPRKTNNVLVSHDKSVAETIAESLFLQKSFREENEKIGSTCRPHHDHDEQDVVILESDQRIDEYRLINDLSEVKRPQENPEPHDKHGVEVDSKQDSDIQEENQTIDTVEKDKFLCEPDCDESDVSLSDLFPFASFPDSTKQADTNTILEAVNSKFNLVVPKKPMESNERPLEPNNTVNDEMTEVVAEKPEERETLGTTSLSVQENWELKENLDASETISGPLWDEHNFLFQVTEKPAEYKTENLASTSVFEVVSNTLESQTAASSDNATPCDSRLPLTEKTEIYSNSNRCLLKMKQEEAEPENTTAEVRDVKLVDGNLGKLLISSTTKELFDSDQTGSVTKTSLVLRNIETIFNAKQSLLPEEPCRDQIDLKPVVQKRKMGSTRKKLREDKMKEETVEFDKELGVCKDHHTKTLITENKAEGKKDLSHPTTTSNRHSNPEDRAEVSRNSKKDGDENIDSNLHLAQDGSKLNVQHDSKLVEDSLLSEIQQALSVTSPCSSNFQLIINEPNPVITDIPDEIKTLSQTQGVKTFIESKSPEYRKRKIGSTRKNPKQLAKAEMEDKDRKVEEIKENLNTAKQGMEEYKVSAEQSIKEEQPSKEYLHLPSVIACQQEDGAKLLSQEKTSPSTKKKFGSRRANKDKHGSSSLPVSDDGKDGDNLKPERPLSKNSQLNDGLEDSDPSLGSQQKIQSRSEEAPSKVDQALKYDRASGTRQTAHLRNSTFDVVQFNVVMVGDSCVGKTSFIRRFHKGHFTEDYSSTIGVDTCTQTVALADRTVKLQMWDTAGQERFHSITKQVFHKADGILLMYAISSSKSFVSLRDWICQAQERAPEHAVMLLLGNKSDSVKREVQFQEGLGLAEEYTINFMECSAATGANVTEAMRSLAELLVQRNTQKEEHTVLRRDPPQKQSGCC